MSAIWLLSTRGRPEQCQAVLDACKETRMRSQGVVYVDETVDQYKRLRLPRNWDIHYEPNWGSLQAAMSWCFETFPDADQYGWLADDTFPRTKHWDRRLEKAAGDWKLAYCNDDWLATSGEANLDLLRKCQDLSSGLCWGGELVRTVGWWALPGVRQAGIDTAWTDICRPTGLFEYLDDVLVEHKNWRTGKRSYDAVDNWERDGHDYITDDVHAKMLWETSEDYRKILNQLIAFAPLAADARSRAAAAKELSAGIAAPGNGMPAARRARLEAEKAG